MRISPLGDRQTERRWLALFVVARSAATAIAAALLLFGGLRGDDEILLIAAVVFGIGSIGALTHWPALRRLPAVWALEFAAALTLVYLSGDWRSPFYFLWLTTLALPAVHLPLLGGCVFGAASTAAFVLVAFVGGPLPGHLAVRSTETMAIHVLLPGMVCFGIAYAADVVRRLHAERERREHLAVQAERRRIAWELHDSAKQRVHAAHLMVSAMRGRTQPETAPVLEQALAELESAASDMDTSLAELHSPLEGRPLVTALRGRAEELARASGVAITVNGEDRPLPPLAGAHAFRIASEAMTNAVRHAAATTITADVRVGDDALHLTVDDDGIGLPAGTGADRGGHGLLAMRSRATSLGGEVRVGAGADGRGTSVQLVLPVHNGNDPTKENR